MKNKTITGQEITLLRTSGSMYDNNCIVAIDDKENLYKMKVEEILKIPTDFNNIVFNIVKKSKYDYLEVDTEKRMV